MHDILFSFGRFQIHSFGFFVGLGMIVSYILLMQEAKRNNIDSTILSNIFFWSGAIAFLGAHAGYVIMNFDYFLAYPWEALDPRSGFIFLSGLASGIIASYIMIRKQNLNYLQVMDMVSPGLALAYALGRIGCYMHGCCYGIVSNCVLAVQFPPNSPAGDVPSPRLPIQLLSSLVSIGIFTVLTAIRKRRHFNGQIFISYVIMYAFTRLCIEFFRGEHYRQIGMLDVGQWFYLALGVLSISWFFIAKNRESARAHART